MTRRLQFAVRLWSGRSVTDARWLREGFRPGGPDLEEFLAEAPPAGLRNSHYVAVALILVLVGLASVMKVDMIVTGSGRLATDAPTIVLQPMQLSIIRQIKVQAGDVVRQGDVLATLDATFTQADRAALTAQHNTLLLRQARMEAEIDGTAFEAAGASADGALEMSLYRQRQDQYGARLREFDGKLASQSADAVAAELNGVSLAQQLIVSREVEAMRAQLYQSQSGSKLNYLEAQAGRMRTERDLRAAATQLNEDHQAIRSLQADRQAYIDGWRRELLEGLVKVRSDLTSVEDSLAKAARLNDLVVLTAPTDGVVLDVAKRSVGSVLHEAEPLITLVPSDAALMGEITIGSSDVGYARVGDEVVVKVDAFPYQRHGSLLGRLRSIGEQSFAASEGNVPGGAHYHQARIVLTDTHLRGMQPGAKLIPGMTVNAEIKVGSRSVISYFLYPITRALNESIREP